MTPSDRIEQIRQRAEKATKGPWEHRFPSSLWVTSGKDYYPVANFNFNASYEENVIFIAHSREDIPWLLSQLDRMREALEKYRHVSVADGDKAAFNYAEELLTSLQKGGGDDK